MAVTTSAVNMRAGPDVSYPVVTTLGSGFAVEVVGCVEGYTWCDVVAGPNRGWVSAQYLSYGYNRQPTVIGYAGPMLGVPLITFSIGNYWDNHYRSRPWYGNRDYWYHRHAAPPPAWRPDHHPPQHDWNRGRGDDHDWDRNRGNAGREWGPLRGKTDNPRVTAEPYDGSRQQ